MGFFDKVRAYLNEDEPEDNLNTEETLKKTDADTEEADTDDSLQQEEKRESIFSKLGKFFSSRKKDESEETVSEDDEIAALSASGKRMVDPERKAVKDFCEQLVDVSFHMDEIAREYKLVTSYLTDIQRIEELPIDMAKELIGISQKIEMLDKNRQTYLQSENLLTMEQYNTIGSLENEVVDTIVKLNDMEMRDSMLKNDMGHLEGEKEDLRFVREECGNRIVRIRGVILTILTLFLITSAILLVVALTTRESVTMYALIVGAIAMLSFAISYAQYIELKSDMKDADAKIKRAVSLLNKVKVKFINNTNTLDYIYEKYGVNSAKELEYQWEQYNTMLRDARKYSHANSEFRVYCDKLVAMLTNIGLKDPLVWPKQTNAIIDRREMVEIKHGLNVRRGKLRDQMATCDKIKTNAHIALRAAVTDNPGMEGYITEQLAPYDIKIEL